VFRVDAVGDAMNPVTESDHFGCGPSAVDRFWCPADRSTTLSGSLDLIGVHVQTKHSYVMRFFGSERELSDFTVTQIEPDDA